MVNDLKTVAVTTKEGGLWQDFILFQRQTPNATVHAIKFSDGRIWDAVNGFRMPSVANGK